MTENGRGTILVLDDDPYFRSLIRSLLEDRGFNVTEAASPNEANARFTKDVVLLIVDYRLPQMDGMTWITKFKEAGKKVPIVFCSAVPCDITTFNRLRNILQVSLILQKPIVPAQFVQQIESLIPRYEEQTVTQSSENSDMDVDEESVAQQKLAKIEQSQRVAAAIKAAQKTYIEVLNTHWTALTELIQTQIKFNNSQSNTSRKSRKKNKKKKSQLIDAVRDAIDVVPDAIDVAHKLRGTAGSFGFIDVGQISGNIEDLLIGLAEQDSSEQQETWSQIAIEMANGQKAIDAIREEEEESAEEAEVDTTGLPQALIVTSDPNIEIAVTSPECRRIANVEIVRPGTSAAELDQLAPRVVLLDSSDCPSSLHDWASEFKQQFRKIALGFICDYGHTVAESDALFAGASAVIEVPLSPTKIADVLMELLYIAQSTNHDEDNDVEFVNSQELMNTASVMLSRNEKKGQPITIARISLDHYADIALLHGSFSAHQVAAAVAKILSKYFRTEDVCARLCAPEFAVVVNNSSKEAVAVVLREAAREFAMITFNGSNFAFNATVSVGVSDSKSGGKNARDLIRSANSGMHSVRRTGTAVSAVS